MKHIDNTKKMDPSKKTSHQKQFMSASPTSTQNQYLTISQLDENSTDFNTSNISSTISLSQNSGKTMVANTPHEQIKELNSPVVSFLKSRVLRKEDINHMKQYNKELLTDSFYWFIKHLKLIKYFFNSSDFTETNTDVVLDPDRC